MGAHPSSAQVHYATRGVDQPGIRIPLIGIACMAAIGARQALHPTDSAGTGQLDRQLGVVGRNRAARLQCKARVRRGEGGIP